MNLIVGNKACVRPGAPCIVRAKGRMPLSVLAYRDAHPIGDDQCKPVPLQSLVDPPTASHRPDVPSRPPPPPVPHMSGAAAELLDSIRNDIDAQGSSPTPQAHPTSSEGVRASPARAASGSGMESDVEAAMKPPTGIMGVAEMLATGRRSGPQLQRSALPTACTVSENIAQSRAHGATPGGGDHHADASEGQGQAGQERDSSGAPGAVAPGDQDSRPAADLSDEDLSEATPHPHSVADYNQAVAKSSLPADDWELGDKLSRPPGAGLAPEGLNGEDGRQPRRMSIEEYNQAVAEGLVEGDEWWVEVEEMVQGRKRGGTAQRPPGAGLLSQDDGSSTLLPPLAAVRPPLPTDSSSSSSSSSSSDETFHATNSPSSEGADGGASVVGGSPEASQGTQAVEAPLASPKVHRSDPDTSAMSGDKASRALKAAQRRLASVEAFAAGQRGVVDSSAPQGQGQGGAIITDHVPVHDIMQEVGPAGPSFSLSSGSISSVDEMDKQAVLQQLQEVAGKAGLDEAAQRELLRAAQSVVRPAASPISSPEVQGSSTVASSTYSASE
ncbi:hypothetical protein QJQ45_017037 [Haematococcus lacustris]|nr:hypothetical protein QJQ45_017037 [Haematococcus lacustris]